MSYTTAVTDRTAADIAAKNSKAYFNVADWTRIYRNGQIVARIVGINGDGIDYYNYPVIAAPTEITLPSVTVFNSWLTVINTIQDDVSGAYPLKHDWTAGAGETAPNYTDVNSWEIAIDAIWNLFNGSSYDVCPSLTGNLTLSADYIVIDCIDTNGHTLDTNGHSLYIV